MNDNYVIFVDPNLAKPKEPAIPSDPTIPEHLKEKPGEIEEFIKEWEHDNKARMQGYERKQEAHEEALMYRRLLRDIVSFDFLAEKTFPDGFTSAFDVIDHLNNKDNRKKLASNGNAFVLVGSYEMGDAFTPDVMQDTLQKILPNVKMVVYTPSSMLLPHELQEGLTERGIAYVSSTHVKTLVQAVLGEFEKLGVKQSNRIGVDDGRPYVKVNKQRKHDISDVGNEFVYRMLQTQDEDNRGGITHAALRDLRSIGHFYTITDLELLKSHLEEKAEGLDIDSKLLAFYTSVIDEQVDYKRVDLKRQDEVKRLESKNRDTGVVRRQAQEKIRGIMKRFAPDYEFMKSFSFKKSVPAKKKSQYASTPDAAINDNAGQYVDGTVQDESATPYNVILLERYDEPVLFLTNGSEAMFSDATRIAGEFVDRFAKLYEHRDSREDWITGLDMVTRDDLRKISSQCSKGYVLPLFEGIMQGLENKGISIEAPINDANTISDYLVKLVGQYMVGGENFKPASPQDETAAYITSRKEITPPSSQTPTKQGAHDSTRKKAFIE